MGHIFSYKKARLIALFGVIVLAVLLSRCVGGDDAGGKSPGSVSCRWVKSNFEDHTMYIRTVDDIPGIYTDKNGKQCDALFTLGRTNEAFYAIAKLGRKCWEPDDTSVRVDATLTFPKSEAGYSQQEAFMGTVSAGDGDDIIIWFTADAKAYIHNALMYYPGTRLDFTVTGSDSSELFEFELPSGDEYPEIIDKTAKAMTIPSYSDKIYEDDDVNLDLKKFFAEFIPEFNNQVRQWAENDGVVGSVLQLLEVSSDTSVNPEMTRLWRQYKRIDVSVLREQDAEFYRRYAEQIDMIVSVRSLASSWTVIDSGLDALDKMAEIASEW